MKLLPESTTSLLFLLLVVELPVLSMSRPTPERPHKEDLKKLFHQMRLLLNLVYRALSHPDMAIPIKNSLPSLPSVNFRAQNLASVEVNKTLSQISSGMDSFKLHFDWLLYWQKQPDLKSADTEEIADLIKSINFWLQRWTHKSVRNNTLHQPPPPTTAWDLSEKSAEILKKLQLFCDWYIRALNILIRQAEKP